MDYLGLEPLACWLVQDNNEEDYLTELVSASHNFSTERNKECGDIIWKSSDDFHKKNSKSKNFNEWTKCTTGMINKHFSQPEIKGTRKKKPVQQQIDKWALRRVTQWR